MRRARELDPLLAISRCRHLIAFAARDASGRGIRSTRRLSSIRCSGSPTFISPRCMWN